MRSHRIAAGTLAATLLLCVATAAGASETATQVGALDALPTLDHSASAAGEPDTALAFGAPLQAARLEEVRGGAELVVNDMQLAGMVADNVAHQVITGSNAITDGAFANASGVPTVIQNTGANTLIQSATILNVQFRP
ncbi:hypothetical protein [Paracidovorax citrulli]